jgi:hypothetical protein
MRTYTAVASYGVRWRTSSLREMPAGHVGLALTEIPLGMVGGSTRPEAGSRQREKATVTVAFFISLGTSSSPPRRKGGVHHRPSPLGPVITAGQIAQWPSS